MPLAVILMAVILVIALLIILIASIGLRSKPADDPSEFALFLARTGRQLNGQADPPAKLQTFVENIPVPRSAASASDRSDQN